MENFLVPALFALAACILLLLFIGCCVLWVAWRHFPEREGIVEKEEDTTSLIPSPIMPAEAPEPATPVPEEKADTAAPEPSPPEPPTEEATSDDEAPAQAMNEAERARLEIVNVLTEKTRQGNIDWQPRTASRGLYDASIPGTSGPQTGTAFLQTDINTGRLILSIASNTPEAPNNFVVIMEEPHTPPEISRALHELYFYSSKESTFLRQITS